MTLICISGKRRSGKTTLANYLQQEYGYFPISLADPLKNLCSREFGLSYEQTDGALKEVPTQYRDKDGIPLTPRDILIKTGQFFRSIDPDFWLKKLFDQMKEKPQAQLGTYIVPDVRFKNEMNWMKRHKALCVRLDRDEVFTGKNIVDPSETELDDYNEWDLHISKEFNKDMADIRRIGDAVNAHVLSRA